MSRKLNGHLFETQEMKDAGLTIENVKNAILYTHNILDEIDAKLIEVGVCRISQMVELANLSSMVGNLIGTGVEKYSNNSFKRNGPHKYPDILAQTENSQNIEIKISLEGNKPKGHLAKEGYYLTLRYVLVDDDLQYNRHERGDIVQIWEARFGYLRNEHFNISNTAGDSGKTAVINAEGMKSLRVIYIDLDKTPYATSSNTYKSLSALVKG